jgi:hypothetical protein
MTTFLIFFAIFLVLFWGTIFALDWYYGSKSL